MTINVTYVPTYRRYLGALDIRLAVNSKWKVYQRRAIKLVDVTDLPF